MRTTILAFALFLFSLIQLNAQNWLPLEVGNKWQYKTWYHSMYTSSYYELTNVSVQNTTVVNNKRYFLTEEGWLRFSEPDQKIYVLYQGNDLVYMDFNLAIGDSGVRFRSDGSQENYLVIGGVVNILGIQDTAKGYRVYNSNEWGGSRVDHKFLPGIGWYYKLSAWGSEFSDNAIDNNLIMSIQFDSSGIPHYIKNHLKAIFYFQPITLINSNQFNLDLQISHPLSEFPSFIFIDSVFFESNYSNEDTVIQKNRKNVLRNTFDQYSINDVLDTNLLKSGFKFNYRLKSKDKGIIPEYTYSPDSGYYQCIWNGPTDIIENNEIVGKYFLAQNFPNPFNPSTKISWQSPVGSWQTLKVYDVLGNEVATLVNEYRNVGSYEVNFDASKLASGVYYYQLKAGDFIQTKKMILIK